MISGTSLIGIATFEQTTHAACVAKLLGRSPETVTPEEIKAYCADKLAKFKIPTQIEFRTELPKTTVGKVLRRELVREHKEKLAAK